MARTKHNNSDLEWRTFSSEIRMASVAGQPPRLAGLAVPFNRETVLIPAGAMFEGSPEIREKIMPGAFTKSLREAEQWALWAHDTSFVLGRKGNGTLRLTETADGLDSEIDPPDTALVRDMVVASVERGDVNGMSFRFWPTREDTETRDDGNTIIFVVREAGIQEVSPTPMPAYESTTISARSQQRIDQAVQEFQERRRQVAPLESAPGLTAHPDTAEAPQDPTPVPAEHPERSAPLAASHLDEALFFDLEIAKRKFRLAA